MERLQRDGIITGHTAIVDARRLGRTLLAHVYPKGPPGTARTMRRMEKITGRTDDMITLRSVNLFPAQIEDLILGIPAFVGPFQCSLTGTGPLDELTVRVERRPDADVSTAYGASSELRALIKNSIGVSVHVDVVEPDQTERSVGKKRRVIDERKHR
ncbi:MAG: phenylacetate-CoA ligase [Pseudonocardiales bacterium]|nr:phenylacetate-CoA ligase [Pseudonocardiales bacterium]